MDFRIIFLFFAFVVYSGRSLATESESTENESAGFPITHSLWISAGGDYVASSSGLEIVPEIPKEDKIRVNTSIPLNLKYSFSFTNPDIKHYLSGGYQGVAVGVMNFGGLQGRGISKSTHNIGYPVLTYIFQGGPFHKFNEKLNIGYEWNFGAAFGWKPYSVANECFNLTVGSRVNAYLSLALNLNWHLTDHTDLFAGVAVSHFSNGNTSFPNPGVNEFGVRVGMRFSLNPPSDGYPKATPDSVKHRLLRYDISAWGAPRKRVYKGGETPVLLKGHYACAGISFSPMFRLNSWWRVGPSLDLQWDESSDLKRNYVEGSTTEDIKFTRPNFFRQVTVGISAHGELRMPIFGVNIGCGYNLVAPWENRGSYQNITLKTYVCESVFINIGYQLRNFQQQSSLMLGAGVSI